jgi:acyl transferase domain-containing protein
MINSRKQNSNDQYTPIAIVGMSCRFPKGLHDIETLWGALQSKFNAIDTVPSDRWTADRYFSSNAISKGKAYIRRGGFLSQDISTFDASFFGISPRDAENMDPQQRILLEVVWEAFENAGLILPDHAGRPVGVYVGGFMLDHMITQMTPSNRSQINQNTAAGMMMTMLSNRISHTYDLRGPSLSIDTACSSSLVAFHYACQDLWRGDCEMAIVGGSNIMLRPEYPMGMCKGHFLARDGECKSFDERGDGYGRGEGAAAILLKPLDAAIANGDPIIATVVGTGANQDGHTPGISMPSGPAQRELIQQVCSKYEIDPSTIRYVECHGTGTAIGDPTEAGAIGSVYGHSSKGQSPVVIGSIKSNIGHLEAAAGVAGVIKAALTVQNRLATPLANLQTPNPAIPFEELGITLADKLISIESMGAPVRAAVNSFGYGGTNAHAILESAPTSCSDKIAQPKQRPAMLENSLPYFLPVSGRSDKALAANASRYHDALYRGADLEDLLYTASQRRAHLSHRAVAKGRNQAELLQALNALAKGEECPNIVKGTVPFHGSRKPVFVFTGMGPQWWAMGQELYRCNKLFRSTLDEADGLFQSISGFSILEEMLKSESESRIVQTEFAQPANLLIQLGLLAILRSAGVHPGAVVGHSVGELASAYAAGVLSLKDCLTVCRHRSRLQAECIGTGVMMAVAMSKEQALTMLSEYADDVSIAAVNGPTNITLAGNADQMSDLASKLHQAGTFHKRLDV